MSGGTISECSASESLEDQLRNVLHSAGEKGGGVYITDSIQVSGGTISCDIVIVPGNSSEEKMQKVGGTISGSIYILPYTRNTSEGGKIKIETGSGSKATIGSVHVAPGVTATLNDVEVGTLTLYAAETYSSTATIGSDTTVKEIKYEKGASATATPKIINNGTITGNNTYNGEVENSGTINGGTFSGAVTNKEGGSIIDGTFTTASTVNVNAGSTLVNPTFEGSNQPTKVDNTSTVTFNVGSTEIGRAHV